MKRDIRDTHVQCEVGGKIIDYDACCSDTLEEGIEYYGDRFTYIGSGRIIYVNGVKNNFDELHHFFKITTK